MSSVQLRRGDVIAGVDTHKDEHVAVMLDGLGGRLAELFIPATLAGFEHLLTFSLSHIGQGRPAGRLRCRGHWLLRDRAGKVPAQPRSHRS